MAYKNVFYYVDFLSKQPSLCVFNHTRYLTLFGAILSLVVIFASFGFGLYFLLNFFKRKNINVVSIKETSGFHNGFNLSDTLLYLCSTTTTLVQFQMKLMKIIYYRHQCLPYHL